MERAIKRKKKRIHINAFDVINYIVLGLFALITLYPLIYTLVGSFSVGPDFMKGGVWIWPRVFTLANYRIVLGDSRLWHSFMITILKAGIGSATGIIFTSVIAYAMARPQLKFRNFFYWANLFTMFFSGGLVPYYLLIVALNLYDSFLVYIIPAMYSVYNMIILTNFFRSISEEMHDAAIIEGANEFRIYWRVYMPLSTPALATVVLWLAVGHWNGYYGTMVYTNAGGNGRLMTLQYYLLKLIKEQSVPDNIPVNLQNLITADTVSYAAMIIATIPILCVYPFVQKFFNKGIMIGALKS